METNKYVQAASLCCNAPIFYILSNNFSAKIFLYSIITLLTRILIYVRAFITAGFILRGNYTYVYYTLRADNIFVSEESSSIC